MRRKCLPLAGKLFPVLPPGEGGASLESSAGEGRRRCAEVRAQGAADFFEGNRDRATRGSMKLSIHEIGWKDVSAFWTGKVHKSTPKVFA